MLETCLWFYGERGIVGWLHRIRVSHSQRRETRNYKEAFPLTTAVSYLVYSIYGTRIVCFRCLTRCAVSHFGCFYSWVKMWNDSFVWRNGSVSHRPCQGCPLITMVRPCGRSLLEVKCDIVPANGLLKLRFEHLLRTQFGSRRNNNSEQFSIFSLIFLCLFDTFDYTC